MKIYILIDECVDCVISDIYGLTCEEDKMRNILLITKVPSVSVIKISNQKVVQQYNESIFVFAGIIAYKARTYEV